MEIRLYSNSALTMAQLDTHIDWDCSVSTKKLCDFCPALATSIPQMCLEDLTGSGRVSGYLKASYNFDTASVEGYGREFYRSISAGKAYDFWLGTPFPQPRSLKNDPHRTEAHGLYFDGDDFITGNTIKDTDTSLSQILTLENQFSVDFWVRFMETELREPIYMF